MWSALARRDIQELSDYYQRIDPGLGERMERAVEAAPRPLHDYPKMGRRTAVAGVRKLRVPGTPYLLFYRADSERLTILRVMHASRDVFW